jgi:thiol-disulfide isomerase/thioredoxin
VPRIRLVPLAVAVLVAGSGLAAYRHFRHDDTVVLSNPTQTSAVGFPIAPKLTGKSLPNVPLQTFDGTTVKLASLAGKPSVINLWAESCLPCKEEMPAFEAVHQQFGDRIHFVGVDTQDAIDRARAFAQKAGVTYDLWRDPEAQLMTGLGFPALPATVFIDSSGHIVASKLGAMTGPQLTAKLEELFPK